MLMGIGAQFMGMAVFVNLQFFIQYDFPIFHCVNGVGGFGQKVKIMRDENIRQVEAG